MLETNSKIHQRLESWCSGHGIQFVDKEAEDAYKKRTRRITDAIELKKPDRVPIVPMWEYFYARYAKVSCYDVLYNREITSWAVKKTVKHSQIPTLVILIAVLILYIVLGCIMDIFAPIFVTLPVLYPLMMALGFDSIWFGVQIVMMVCLGSVTPPVGILVFAVKGMAKDVPLSTVFKGTIPFVLAMLVCVIILIVFPSDICVFASSNEFLIDLWIKSLIRQGVKSGKHERQSCHSRGWLYSPGKSPG